VPTNRAYCKRAIALTPFHACIHFFLPRRFVQASQVGSRYRGGGQEHHPLVQSFLARSRCLLAALAISVVLFIVWRLSASATPVIAVAAAQGRAIAALQDENGRLTAELSEVRSLIGAAVATAERAAAAVAAVAPRPGDTAASERGADAAAAVAEMQAAGNGRLLSLQNALNTNAAAVAERLNELQSQLDGLVLSLDAGLARVRDLEAWRAQVSAQADDANRVPAAHEEVGRRQRPDDGGGAVDGADTAFSARRIEGMAAQLEAVVSQIASLQDSLQTHTALQSATLGAGEAQAVSARAAPVAGAQFRGPSSAQQGHAPTTPSTLDALLDGMGGELDARGQQADAQLAPADAERAGGQPAVPPATMSMKGADADPSVAAVGAVQPAADAVADPLSAAVARDDARVSGEAVAGGNQRGAAGEVAATNGDAGALSGGEMQADAAAGASSPIPGDAVPGTDPGAAEQVVPQRRPDDGDGVLVHTAPKGQDADEAAGGASQGDPFVAPGDDAAAQPAAGAPQPAKHAVVPEEPHELSREPGQQEHLQQQGSHQADQVQQGHQQQDAALLAGGVGEETLGADAGAGVGGSSEAAQQPKMPAHRRRRFALRQAGAADAMQAASGVGADAKAQGADNSAAGDSVAAAPSAGDVMAMAAGESPRAADHRTSGARLRTNRVGRMAAQRSDAAP
jgi:hypothetical protein